MRIDPNSPPSPVRSTRNVRTQSSVGFSVSQGDSDNVSAATSREIHPATQALAPTSLDAMLALQGYENATEKKKRAVRRGNDLLDQLDNLKRELLDGSVNTKTLYALKSLAQDVQDLQHMPEDKALTEILLAIELRAAVEVAKFERSHI